MLAPAPRELDWHELRAMPGVRRIPAEALDLPHGEIVYVATPIRQYLARGEAGQCVQLAAEWQAWLLSEGLSPVCPVLLTVPPLLARGDDHVGLMLQAMEHDWWMRRCLPWMDACNACVVPPITGWQMSEGAWQEAMTFARWRRPVRLLEGRP